MGWQWHQLDHMQIICTSLQTANHASTSPIFYSNSHQQQRHRYQQTACSTPVRGWSTTPHARSPNEPAHVDVWIMLVGLSDVHCHVTVTVWHTWHLYKGDVRLRQRNDVTYQLHTQQHRGMPLYSLTALYLPLVDSHFLNISSIFNKCFDTVCYVTKRAFDL